MISSFPLPKPDVALVLPSLEGGGAERVFLRLAELFCQRGLVVDVVVARREGALISSVSEFVRLVDLHSSRPSRAIPALVCYLRQARPKAVMSALTHTNIALAIAHRLANVSSRCVLSERADLRVCLHQEKAFWDESWNRILGKLVYPWADHVVAVSRGVARSVVEVMGVSEHHVQVIYNPIDPEKVNQHSRQPVEFPWRDDLPIVIAVGRLVAQKDYPCLLRAFARLIQHTPCHLAILGEGEDRESLDRLISQLGIAQQVWMPGFICNPLPWVAKAKVLALSSRWEGLPGVLLEGLALGVPIVATDCPSGPAEILEQGRFGTLIPPGDSEKLARALSKVLAGESPVFLREEALDRFQSDRVVEQYFAVLGIGL
ncbi:glycosyltransferase [Methyloterricola oryzae]|uniref:glycosyltransferase n=1 Tax=Methyloterricola oryzae TaxID=1495050 RepID=UPI0009E399D1|nr:glycosyltransferase [Methyloterricola oryzae]